MTAKQIALAYNGAGQVLWIDRYQDGKLAVEGDYRYDAWGRLVGLVYHQGENVLNRYAWTYSDSGQWPVVSGQKSLATRPQPLAPSSWTPSGGLMPIHDTTGVVDGLLSGGFVGLDLLTSATSIDGTASYNYDPTGQLIGATYSASNPQSPIPNPESYAYDANGNRTNAGYVTGPNNQLLSDGTYWYSYDAEGNRTARFIDAKGEKGSERFIGAIA